MTEAAAHSAVEVEPFEVRGNSDHELDAVIGITRALLRERVAEDPEIPLAMLRAAMRATPDTIERRDWLARADGAPVARAIAWRRLYGDKQHVRNVEIEVLAAHRRRGIATQLLRAVVGSVSADRAAMFGFLTTDRIPAGGEFLGRLGGEAGMAMTTNQLDVATVDRALVARWRDSAPRGYRAVWIDGDVPEELLDNVVAAYEAMAMTPTGSLRIWDFSASRESVRSFERARREQGREHHLVLAIDEATGRTAGFSEVTWHPDQPEILRQGGTAVPPEHQGKGIGKWLKALVLGRILSEHPRARYMRTNNNPVNAPIVAINERLGYRPAWTNTVWQLTLADAQRYLASRT
jgi:GNAT superfamily N-acetyltransferase